MAHFIVKLIDKFLMLENIKSQLVSELMGKLPYFSDFHVETFQPIVVMANNDHFAVKNFLVRI